MFEWDEAKRLATREKHGIDFADLGSFLARPVLTRQARSDVEETGGGSSPHEGARR